MAQIGNDNAAKGCRLRHVLTKRLENVLEAEQVIDALLTKAKDGDVAAIKECFDRSGGKAPQSVTIDATVKNHEMSLDELDRERTDDTQTPS